MVQNIFFFLLGFGLLSCATGKGTPASPTPTVAVAESADAPRKHSRKALRKKTKANAIIATALSFSGTPYKYGGSTHQGMDCSGLVHVALKENGIAFPRVSYQMAKEGKKIPLRKVQRGDLLYFKVSKGKRRINHMGLVVAVRSKDIQFIHATTSKGVLVSSLRERYWDRAFVKAMRIL